VTNWKCFIVHDSQDLLGSNTKAIRKVEQYRC